MSPTAIPLIVDLDGTFTRTDTLFEALWKGIATAPVSTLRTVLTSMRDPAVLKVRLAAFADLDARLLPLDHDVGAAIGAARADGRDVHLVSGADQSVVDAVAAAHGPFASAVGSDGKTNLTDRRKAAYLVERFGEGEFDYIGDSTADLNVWPKARKAFVARPSSGLQQRIASAGLEAEALGTTWAQRDVFSALRPYHWAKNTLLFLPLLLVGRFDSAFSVLLAVLAFSALASATYILNDLTDLEADRQHPRKKDRPFAAGRVPIITGMVAAVALGLLALGIGAFLGGAMVGILILYTLAALAYSIWLKPVRWVDVVFLAGFNLLRVVAGAVAAGVALSGGAMAVAIPLCLCLACIKRVMDLSGLDGAGAPARLGYAPSDRTGLMTGAIATGVAAAVAAAFAAA